MSEETDINKKEENENPEEIPKKKKKKKKKKAETTEEKPEEKAEKPEEENKNKNENNKDINPNKNNEEEEENLKELTQEALSNIPSKEVPKKKKKKKKKKEEENENIKEEKAENEVDNKETKEKAEKELDINDILNKNNDNNNGDLMITELNIDGEKKKKKKKKKAKNGEDKEKEKDKENKDVKENEGVKENENENIKEIINEDEKPIDEKNEYLNQQYNSIEATESLKNGINNSIIKINEEIDIKNKKVKIRNNILNNDDISNINKSLENILSGNKKVFLTDVNKYFLKENIKNLKFLRTQEQAIRKNIAKLNQSQQIIENTMPLKANIIENNIRTNQLKNIYKTKDELNSRLEKINQKIDILLNDEKIRQKMKNQNITDIIKDINDNDDKFNMHLKQMQKSEKNIREKYEKDLQKTINKRNKEIDKKEKNIKELKKMLFNEARRKEKEKYLKRKNEINEQLEKTKKYINEKMQKSEKDYLFFKYQENFEKKEQKLYSKINMIKREPLVTQEDLKELSERVKQQKQYLQDNAEEKKRQMQILWSNRSHTLPTYRNPIFDKNEEEKLKKLNDEEEERKKKECNQLEKINYKPPSVKVNKRLKQLREKKLHLKSKEMVLETELNNKKRLNIFKFTPITSNKNPIIKDEKSLELNNNNYIDLTEVKKSLNIKNKNKLKPIQILNPKPQKPIDYLKEMKENRNMSNDIEKKKSINFDDLFNKDKKNGNIIESLEVAKIRTDSIDRKVERKKEFMHSNGGYLKNPYLAGEIGDLLVESIQAKLKLMNTLGGGEES